MNLQARVGTLRADANAVVQLMNQLRVDAKMYDLFHGNDPVLGEFTDAKLVAAGITGISAEQLYTAVVQFNALTAAFTDPIQAALLVASP